MSRSVAFRIALRELGGGMRGFRIFLACLALGVAAIAAVGSVRESIEAGLAREGAVLLGGDAQVEFTYRRADETERAYLDGIATRVSEVIDFRSMAQTADGADRSLTQVKAVDDAWPLLGEAELDPPMPLAELYGGRDGLPGAALSPLLMERLELDAGDVFRLGDQDFVAMAALVSVPDNASAGFGFGPPMLVRTQDLAASGLIREGTLFNALYRLDLPEGTALSAARADMRRALGAAPRWRDARNGTPGVSRAVERLGRFLVLVGLAGLAVGGVGISAAVRAYLAEKTTTIATLKVLGADRRTIFAIYGIQIGILTLAGIVLGVALGAGLPLLFGPILSASLPVPVAIGVHAGPLLEAALYGMLAAALFSLWPLATTQDVRAAALYRDAATGARARPRRTTLIWTLALLLMLVAVAVTFSGTPRITLGAAGGILAAFLLLVGLGRMVRLLAARLAGAALLRGRPALRMALASIGGPGGEASSVVVSLGLGLTVLAAVGQIDNNLRGAIARELPSVAPSFFVVDIQPEQIEDFTARIEGDPGVSAMDRAPMLRGMITTINGLPASEVAGNHWVVRGDRGVTYSALLPDRTELTAGEWWAQDYDGPPLISFSAEEAEEIGLEIGDEMSLNILGREISGTVASFRAVDFSTAGMGFTIAMNPTALAGAPHSWIATVYADQAAEGAIMRDLGRAWPNITVISVRDAIAQVTDLMGKVAAAITYGALITLVTGGVVLIGAAAAGERARTYEAAVLKTLGASRGWVLANFALRSGLLGAAAGLVAVFAGGLAGWAVSRFVMETRFVFDPGSALAIVAGGVVLTIAAGLVFAWRPLATPPSRVLRGRE